jgi:hypothetical protein
MLIVPQYWRPPVSILVSKSSCLSLRSIANCSAHAGWHLMRAAVMDRIISILILHRCRDRGLAGLTTMLICGHECWSLSRPELREQPQVSARQEPLEGNSGTELISIQDRHGRLCGEAPSGWPQFLLGANRISDQPSELSCWRCCVVMERVL